MHDVDFQLWERELRPSIWRQIGASIRRGLVILGQNGYPIP
jgi:hypothetical protein